MSERERAQEERASTGGRNERKACQEPPRSATLALASAKDLVHCRPLLSLSASSLHVLAPSEPPSSSRVRRTHEQLFHNTQTYYGCTVSSSVFVLRFLASTLLRSFTPHPLLYHQVHHVSPQPLSAFHAQPLIHLTLSDLQGRSIKSQFADPLWYVPERL